MAKVKAFYWINKEGWKSSYKSYAAASRALGISKELVRYYASRGIHSEADKAWSWRKPKKQGNQVKRENYEEKIRSE